MNDYKFWKELLIRKGTCPLMQRHNKGCLIDFTGVDPERRHEV